MNIKSKTRYDWNHLSRALFEVWRSMDETNLSLTAAGVAFYGMLAIFPGVAAIIALWGFFADPIIINTQMELLAEIIPSPAFELLDGQVTALIAANDSTLGWTTAVSTLAAFWAARAGVAALIRGLNVTYRERQRSGLGRLIAAVLVTFALVGMVMVAMVSVVVTPVVLAFVPLGGWSETVLNGTRWIVSLLVVVFGLGIVYRFGPNRRRTGLGFASPGALVAVVVWAIASAAFSLYLQNFSAYNQVYGSIGAAIALLIWFYISAYVILLGGALNSALELHAPERE